VTNTRDEAVDVEVTDSITGSVEDAAGGVVTKLAKADATNPSNLLTVRAKLAPGEHKTWMVRYRSTIGD
jgi:hypothetical protein